MKAASNLHKHNVDFADAVGVFEDEWALTIREHYVEDEQRWATIGIGFLGRMLVVFYTYRNSDLRLISARRTSRSERQQHEEGI